VYASYPFSLRAYNHSQIRKMENLPSYKELNKARRVLDIPEIATLKQIKFAYHKLVMKYHPDKCERNKKSFCTKKTAEINHAYKILTTYIQNYMYIFTERAYKEQDQEYVIKRFYTYFKEGKE